MSKEGSSSFKQQEDQDEERKINIVVESIGNTTKSFKSNSPPPSIEEPLPSSSTHNTWSPSISNTIISIKKYKWKEFEAKHVFLKHNYLDYNEWGYDDWNSHAKMRGMRSSNNFKPRNSLIVGTEESIRSSFENGVIYTFKKVTGEDCWSIRPFEMFLFDLENDNNYKIYRSKAMYACVTLENKTPVHLNGQAKEIHNKPLQVDITEWKEIEKPTIIEPPEDENVPLVIDIDDESETDESMNTYPLLYELE